MCKLIQQVLPAGTISVFKASDPGALVSYQIVYLVNIIVCQFLDGVCHSVLVIMRDVSITSKPAYLLHNLPPHVSHGHLAFLTCLFQLPFIALMFRMGGAYRQFRDPSSSPTRVFQKHLFSIPNSIQSTDHWYAHIPLAVIFARASCTMDRAFPILSTESLPNVSAPNICFFSLIVHM